MHVAFSDAATEIAMSTYMLAVLCCVSNSKPEVEVIDLIRAA